MIDGNVLAAIATELDETLKAWQPEIERLGGSPKLLRSALAVAQVIARRHLNVGEPRASGEEMTMTFNPMGRAPETDEEAHVALRHSREPDMGATMVGLYDVMRAQGMSILDAMRDTLLHSLPDERLEAVAHAIPDAARVLAERRALKSPPQP